MLNTECANSTFSFKNLKKKEYNPSLKNNYFHVNPIFIYFFKGVGGTCTWF